MNKSRGYLNNMNKPKPIEQSNNQQLELVEMSETEYKIAEAIKQEKEDADKKL